MLFLIPARGGSKRLPGKNLKELAGIPLVAHAIRRAQGAARILGGPHQVVVSTDSEDIARVAREWGADVIMRPAELAADDTPMAEVILHAVKSESYILTDCLVLVQPTSPLAAATDLVWAARAARTSGGLAVTTDEDGRRNGAAYACVRGTLPDGEATAEITMPASRSIDIDTADDWYMAEALLAARPVAPFAIPERDFCNIGPGWPTLVIAEAGVNHDGYEDKAHKLIDAAADSGADAVKFQAFVPELLAEPGPHLDMLKRLAIPQTLVWAALKKHAEERGLVFLASAFDVPSVDFLDALGVPAFKVPSGEITNIALLRHIATRGKPVILSTGMSTMREVAFAVDALTGVPLALLHCVSAYPTPSARVNLRAIDTLRMAFGVPVGWSDHTEARLPSALAVARGACIVEKHLTLDRAAPGPDHAMSATPADFRRMVRGIHLAEAALGHGVKGPMPIEAETAKVARRRDGLRRNAS